MYSLNRLRMVLKWFSTYHWLKWCALVVAADSCHFKTPVKISYFLSFCPYKLLSAWDACPWVCILCVCVWWPLLWCVRTLKSHMPHSWPWNRELWDCLGFMTSTHSYSSLWLFIEFYMSDCSCISPSHGKKRLFVWQSTHSYASEMPQMFTSLQKIWCLHPLSK